MRHTLDDLRLTAGYSILWLLGNLISRRWQSWHDFLTSHGWRKTTWGLIRDEIEE